ncbi:hypothetical protein BT69DRAFT_1376799 [Atractiella rhizophila]|nr:hypothetical protein BT69DRAFT_1376799 [Atractiella rhizophila]
MKEQIGEPSERLRWRSVRWRRRGPAQPSEIAEDAAEDSQEGRREWTRIGELQAARGGCQGEIWFQIFNVPAEEGRMQDTIELLLAAIPGPNPSYCNSHLWDLWSGKVEPVEGDRHLLSTDQNILIGEVMHNAVIDLPARFSNRIRNLDKFRNTRYSIYEWLAWVHWYSVPILLEVGFHIELIQHWTNFVSAIKIITKIHAASLSQLKVQVPSSAAFVLDLRSSTCGTSLLWSAVFQCRHQPPHIVPLSRVLGSLMNFTQLPLERNLGTEKDKRGSRRLPYAELANNLIRREQLNILKLYIPRIDTSPKPTKRRKTFSAKSQSRTFDSALESSILTALQSYLTSRYGN